MYALDSTRTCSPSGTAATGEITGCRVVTPPFVVVRKPTPQEIKGVFCPSAFAPKTDNKTRRDRAHVTFRMTNPFLNCINKQPSVIELPHNSAQTIRR